jgi:hypothetical protein
MTPAGASSVPGEALAVSFRRWPSSPPVRRRPWPCPEKVDEDREADENDDQLTTAPATSDGHDHHLPPPLQHHIDEPTHAMI